MEHLNNIGFNDIERLKTKEAEKIHLIDPYLNNNDVNKLSKTNLGDSFTFVFNTGNTQTVTLANNSDDNLNNNSENKTYQQNKNIDTIPEEINIQETQKQPIQQLTQQPIQQPIQKPTPRQIKIISFLEKQTSIEDSGQMFYKMLDNKLQLEDYKGLQNMITHLNIDNVFKENYIKVIESFVSLLVKQSTSGIKNYKDKNISQLVCNLTS